MENNLTVGKIIKRYIALRHLTIKEVAEKLNMNYKTLDGILNRDAIDAKRLFQLANLLDIDLCWMAQLYDKKRPISILEQYQMSRMSPEMRESEKQLVLKRLDHHIKTNLTNINDVKTELLRDFNQLFYLLDVLLPETYIIRIAVERDREKYYCMPMNTTVMPSRLGRGRSAITQFYEGHEMLKQIIMERKAVIEQ